MTQSKVSMTNLTQQSFILRCRGTYLIHAAQVRDEQVVLIQSVPVEQVPPRPPLQKLEVHVNKAAPPEGQLFPFEPQASLRARAAQAFEVHFAVEIQLPSTVQAPPTGCLTRDSRLVKF